MVLNGTAGIQISVVQDTIKLSTDRDKITIKLTLSRQGQAEGP
jgi:hypothetical protein